MNISTIPAPPEREQWGFLQDLRQPEPIRLHWDFQAPLDNTRQLDLRPGLTFLNRFPDPEELLATAYQDGLRFLQATGLPSAGPVPLQLQQEDLPIPGSYRLQVTATGITLSAPDSEGLRHGIFFLEDLAAEQCAPALPYGTWERTPWLKNRISRCFFGPIKRPPFNRDELLDDLDYYPDEYLNRLAHEGINGLWLTITFRELAETSFSPRDPLAHQRLEKLRRTVQQCRRYGIKIWLFSIEPRHMEKDDPLLLANPEFAGAFSYAGTHCFCPSSPQAQQYLYESTRDIFRQVPNLGGLINISHGERPTTCLSSVAATADHDIDCPRCGKIPKWQVHANALGAMLKGIRESNPQAELISWLYQPQPIPERGKWTFELARNVPEGVILQYNFESGACKKQLSRARLGGDYWLSYVGPSASFSRIADGVSSRNGSLSAKIQVGCSHEVATVPFVSVPGLLYQKYAAMRRHGCSSVMQCWYFGNYPGIMNRAAGQLAYEEFHDDEQSFLLRLARPQWGRHAQAVAEAWHHFTRAYENYPLSNDMQYYGPMQFGPIWPLHLKVELLPLGPTWKPDYPPSGDCIGECLENHTLEEALLLSRRISSEWDRGLRILQELRPDFLDQPPRLLDICVSAALGCQFRSAAHIFEFYLLRRELYLGHSVDRSALLARMRTLVLAEIANSGELAELCRQDSRLGFHSEAEAHQYCESRLLWRQELLQQLLDTDFAAAEQAVAQNAPLPQSDFEQNAPTYALNSGWVDGDTLRWRIDRNDEQDLLVRFEARNLPYSNDVLTVCLLDATGTCFPWIINVPRQGEPRQLHPLAEVRTSYQDDSWSAELHLPSLLWNRDRKIEPRYVYLHRTVSSHDNPNPPYHYDWPPHPSFPRIRLNIYLYQGNYCGRLLG
ncbi:MAG: hypothetical protein GX902_01765 [Lentisphaerae bacterium]|nr:hypothetical protein [Lentisphaerota bacterium]